MSGSETISDITAAEHLRSSVCKWINCKSPSRFSMIVKDEVLQLPEAGKNRSLSRSYKHEQMQYLESTSLH